MRKLPDQYVNVIVFFHMDRFGIESGWRCDRLWLFFRNCLSCPMILFRAIEAERFTVASVVFEHSKIFFTGRALSGHRLDLSVMSSRISGGRGWRGYVAERKLYQVLTSIKFKRLECVNMHSSDLPTPPEDCLSKNCEYWLRYLPRFSIWKL